MGDQQQQHNKGRSARKDTTWDPTWDEGLNKGRLARKDIKTGRRIESPPKAYAAESGQAVRSVKVIAQAIMMVVPYYTVLQSLGIQGGELFEPCTDACSYMQIFTSSVLPGTGLEVLSVENGVPHPTYLQYAWSGEMHATACLNMPTSRGFLEKVFGQPCPQAALLAVNKTSEPEEPSLGTKLAFIVTKLFQRIILSPVNLVAKFSAGWGMEHVPPALCPGMTHNDMQEMCTPDEQQSKIVNLLGEWTVAKVVTLIGLVGWAGLTAVHDLMLVNRPTKHPFSKFPMLVNRRSTNHPFYSERYTLIVGFLATSMLGIAAVAMCMWGMVTAGVFVAPVTNYDHQQCMCYYRFHHLPSIVGLATPLALYIQFESQVQAQGMAALFGDRLFTQLYAVPFYLVHHSYPWTRGTLVAPKLAGTIQGEERETFDNHFWERLYTWHQALDWFASVVGVLFAMALSPYLIGVEAILINALKIPGLVFYALKYIALPFPSVIALILAAWGIKDIHDKTGGLDPEDGEETFADRLNNYLPDCIFGKTQQHKLQEHPYVENILARTCFAIFTAFWIVVTIGVSVGLFPRLSFLLGNERTLRITLLSNELWGSCGFILFLFHFRSLLRLLYGRWDDIESLRHLGPGAADAGGHEALVANTRPSVSSSMPLLGATEAYRERETVRI